MHLSIKWLYPAATQSKRAHAMIRGTERHSPEWEVKWQEQIMRIMRWGSTSQLNFCLPEVGNGCFSFKSVSPLSFLLLLLFLSLSLSLSLTLHLWQGNRGCHIIKYTWRHWRIKWKKEQGAKKHEGCVCVFTVVHHRCRRVMSVSARTSSIFAALFPCLSVNFYSCSPDRSSASGTSETSLRFWTALGI